MGCVHRISWLTTWYWIANLWEIRIHPSLSSHWKLSQLPGASGVTNLRSEPTTATLLDPTAF